jgi:hypothetical protein
VIPFARIHQIVAIVIPGSSDHQHVVFPGGIHRRLQRLRIAFAAQAHGNDLRARLDRIVNALRDVSIGAVAARIQHLDDNELQGKAEGSHAGGVVGSGGNDPGNMGAVEEVVFPGARRRGYGGCHQRLAVRNVQLAAQCRIRGTAAGIHKIRMGAIGAGIEDGNFHAIGAGVGRGQVVVGEIAPRLDRLYGGQGPLLGEQGVVGRQHGGVADPVGLHILHQRMGRQKFRGHRLDARRKLQQVGVPVAADKAGKRLGHQGGKDLVDIRPELKPDHQLIGYHLFSGTGQKLLPGEQTPAGSQANQQYERQSAVAAAPRTHTLRKTPMKTGLRRSIVVYPGVCQQPALGIRLRNRSGEGPSPVPRNSQIG